MVKENMRKEIKIGLAFFVLFSILNFISNEIGAEIPILHFGRGILVGLAFAEIIIGLLPESIYLKTKNFKKSYIQFIK